MKLSLKILTFACLQMGLLHAQIAVPYSNSFNTLADTVGWTHYALTGTDDWEWGVPAGIYLSTAPSSPYAWGTNLDGNTTPNSVAVLVSPVFDLTSTYNHVLYLSHEYRAPSVSGGNVEYSTDGGSTWLLLNGPIGSKTNWFYSVVSSLGQLGWTGYSSSIRVSSHNLAFLKGMTNVRFRFKFGAWGTTGEGWVVDDFVIATDAHNISANEGIPLVVSALSPAIVVQSALTYDAIYPVTLANRTDFYLSTDSLYDAGDVFMGSRTKTVSGPVPNLVDTIGLPPGMLVGSYFILYRHDATDLLTEVSETDNWGFARLHIDTTLTLPRDYGFESGFEGWKPAGPITWANSPGLMYGAQGVHTGHNGLFVNGGNLSTSYVESDFLNFSTGDTNCICHWAHEDSPIDLKYSIDNRLTWLPVGGTVLSNGFDWDFKVFEPGITLDTAKYVRFRYFGSTSAMDDIHVGKCAPDLSVAIDRQNRFTTTTFPIDTISYFVMNSGTRSSPATQTHFYWSTDTILDGSDTFLGANSEPSLAPGGGLWSNFAFTKPSLVAGVYYLFYVLDATSLVNEMVEVNDTGLLYLHQPVGETLPYSNDFETQIDGWHHKTSVGHDQWVWTTPSKYYLDTAFSGVKAWVSNDTAPVLPYSRFFLYSTVFDLSAAVKPVLEFDMKLHSNSETNAVVNMSYSTDDGMTWTVLDTLNKSYNKWYYPYRHNSGNGYDGVSPVPISTELFFEPYERCFTSFDVYNSRNVRRNTRYNTDVSLLNGYSRIQFRYNLATGDNADSSYGLKEGALIDNFSIREAFSDLTIRDRRTLMYSPTDPKIRLNVDVHNAGNYLSNPGSLGVYLSADSLLDGGDVLLGTQNFKSIAPDWYQYLTIEFPSPGSLGAYNYLLLNSDHSNTTAESDEGNNVTAWPFSTTPIKSFPYFEQFQDTMIAGWHSRAVETWVDTIMQHRWRWRNYLAPVDPVYVSGISPGVMFTDLINPVASITSAPYYYLEGPAFDFSSSDSIALNFDLFCTGAYTPSTADDGGNMDYSIDGGNTWSVLMDVAGTATNWYNATELDNLFDQDGWSGWDGPALIARAIDISFLAGQPDVKFRYKYHSKHSYFGTGSPMGMRVDNFKVSANLLVKEDDRQVPKSLIYVYENQLYFAPVSDAPGPGELKLVDISGRTVFTGPIYISGNVNVYDLPESLPDGIYLIQLTDRASQVHTLRYLKR